MLEVQIVDARGGDFVAAVAASHQTGKLIDPRDQLAAEQTAIAVDMAVHENRSLPLPVLCDTAKKKSCGNIFATAFWWELVDSQAAV